MHRFRVKRHVKREVRFDAMAGAACIDKTEPSDPRCGLGAYVREMYRKHAVRNSFRARWRCLIREIRRAVLNWPEEFINPPLFDI